MTRRRGIATVAALAGTTLAITGGHGDAEADAGEPRARRVAAPRVVADFIAFPARRKMEMASYARRHYGIGSFTLGRPRVIVEHVAVAATVAAVKAAFAR